MSVVSLRKKERHVIEKKWIKDAIKQKGALHKTLRVKKDEKIPKEKLEKASHSSNKKTAKRARLAMTLGKMNRK